MRYSIEPTHPYFVRTRSGEEIGIDEKQRRIIVAAVSKEDPIITINGNTISVKNDFLGIYTSPKQEKNWKGVLRNGTEVIQS